MKKLLLMLVAILLFSCQNPADIDYAEVFEETVIPEDVILDGDLEDVITDTLEEASIQLPSDYLFALYDGLDLKFYDGDQFETMYSGTINYAGNRILSIDDVLYYMDENGSSYKSFKLTDIPDNILVIEKNTRSINSDDVWELIVMSAQESYDLGGIGRIHTKVILNGEEVGKWYNNEWEGDEIIQTPNGEILAVATNTVLHNLSGDTVPFKIYGDLYISDIDYDSRQAQMHTEKGSEWIGYVTNHFINGLWQEADGIYYSSRGGKYIYGEGVKEGSTALFPYAGAKDNNNEYYNFYPSGKITENGEEVTFWIESTSGELWKHIPSVDTFEMVKQLYRGSNSFTTGRTEITSVKPVWIDDKLYFNYDGDLQCYDPVVGSIDIVADSGEVFEW